MTNFAQFTEDGFRDLLSSLKDGGYKTAHYGERPAGRHVLWRHDVDFSIHRAVKLAEIEAEMGVTATYFLHLRGAFYNLLEPGIVDLAHRIRSFGHEIGLHFDGAHGSPGTWTQAILEEAVTRERALLESIIQVPVRCMSWHNPDISNLLDFDATEVGGLVNAYSAELRRDYVYCSDSNGYWRFDPMASVIAQGHERLHLLTHPEWWTPQPLSPSERIDRAILGRARCVRGEYDEFLAKAKRKNLTK